MDLAELAESVMRRPGIGVARRVGFRGIGGSAPASAAPSSLTVLAGISLMDFFSTTDAARPSMSATSTCIVVLRKITSGNIVREYRIERFTSGARGFRHLPMLDGTTARATITMVSGTPANVSEQNTFSPTQNEFQVMTMRRDTAILEQYRAGSLMSVGTAITGYTAPTSEAFVIQSNGALVDEVEIASISISDTHCLSAAEIAAYYTQVKALGSRVIPNATFHLEASDIAAGSWVDRIGGVALTQSGSPVTRVVSNPIFT